MEMLFQMMNEMDPEQMEELMGMLSGMQGTEPGAAGDQMISLIDPAAMSELTAQMAEITEMLEQAAAALPLVIGGMLIGLVVWRIILGLVACIVSRNRGRKGGFWWGFFLGFIGIIVEAVRPKE